jgi:hypothetical protein
MELLFVSNKQKYASIQIKKQDDELDLVSLSSTIGLDLDHYKTTKNFKKHEKGYDSAYQTPIQPPPQRIQEQNLPLKNDVFRLIEL